MTFYGRVKQLLSLCDTKIFIETPKRANIKKTQAST